MKNTRVRRHVPLVLLGALALSLTGGWGGTRAGSAAEVAARDYGSRIVYRSALQGTQSQAGPALKLDTSGTQPTDAFSANQAQAFANPAFQRTWERLDRPVASGQVKRSWYWGPQANSGGLQEPYAEGAGGQRLVQYFDKSRMEINNPGADPNNPFFVTNGLLTVELISGKVQTGNSAYQDRYPADIPLASDPDDPTAPTYLSFQGVSNTTLGDRPASPRLGQAVTSTIARSGAVAEDSSKASYPKVNVAYYEAATKHNIPEAIWEFLNESGPVFNSANGQTQNVPLNSPWFYATGLPISDAYWANVSIAGQKQDVLIQAFERRVVTYVPNGVPGFKVQMGNIGQHYFDWRYKDAGRPANQPPPAGTPAAQPTNTPGGAPPTVPPSTPTTRPDPNADCSNVPASQSMVVRPNCGPGGTNFAFTASGFRPGETVGVYITLPDQSVFGAPFQAEAESDGRVTGIGLRSQPDFPTGIWAITMEGIDTRHRAIGFFKITGAAAPPPGPPAACDPSGSVNGSASPPSARAGEVIRFEARGFRPGEEVSFWFTLPDQSVFGTASPLCCAGPDGFVRFNPIPLPSEFGQYPGKWALTVQGRDSNNTAVIYFCVNP